MISSFQVPDSELIIHPQAPFAPSFDAEETALVDEKFLGVQVVSAGILNHNGLMTSRIKHFLF